MYNTKCFIVFACVVAAVYGRSTQTAQNTIPEETGRSAADSGTYMSDLRFLYKIYQECAATDVSTCLKLKLVTAMDRAARTYSDFNILDGVNFVKDPKAVDVIPTKNEVDIEASLPRSLSDREETLNELILERVFNFFQSHTLQIKLPTVTDLQRSFNGEERGKKKKMGGLLLIPLLLGGTLIPIAFGALALLAGKALIVSKLALVLAAIIGLKKLVSGGHSGGHESGHVEVVSGGHGGGGWGRSFDAQNIAYRAHAPTTQ